MNRALKNRTTSTTHAGTTSDLFNRLSAMDTSRWLRRRIQLANCRQINSDCIRPLDAVFFAFLRCENGMSLVVFAPPNMPTPAMQVPLHLPTQLRIGTGCICHYAVIPTSNVDPSTGSQQSQMGLESLVVNGP